MDPSRTFAVLQDPGRIGHPGRRGFPDAAPGSQHTEGFSAAMISGLPQGFSTCCLRFTSAVAGTHQDSFPGGGLRLFREGVEPSRSR
jgi:hypothetical protein